jgi:metal-responsive CopG/Arc/MetJ family transcriptional regulator
MAKVSVTIRLEQGLLDAIDEHAEWAGTTRTEVMEAALDRGLSYEQDFRKVFDHAGVRNLVDVLDRKGVLEGVAKLLRFEVDRRRVDALKYRVGVKGKRASQRGES